MGGTILFACLCFHVDQKLDERAECVETRWHAIKQTLRTIACRTTLRVLRLPRDIPLAMCIYNICM